jgi:phosphoribosylamine--glycine ligase
MSVFALCDGENALLLDTACDHKRLLDGNAGPNTGGMGAYSPTTWFPREKLNMLKEQIFLPVLREMATRGTPFRGLLYAGLMVRGNDYWVLEFNARFGDPETQALLPRLQSDLLPLLYACAVGDLQRGLDMVAVQWSPQASVAVVLASEGYPEKPILGRPVTVATEPDFTAEKTDEKSVLNADEAQLFFAGAGQNQNSSDGLLHTTGGRVAAVQALAPTLELARGRVYAELSRISFPGMIYRKDIGSYNG